MTQTCYHCQINAKAPDRFKFTLNDEIEFKCEIVIDIMYIGGKPVLHVVDTATSFQAAQSLKGISTKSVWKSLCMCWINVYLGPPDFTIHNSGT